MTFNKRMHPRNKYRSPPNFRQLAVEFEEFREFAIQDLSGKISVDFKNPAALRTLTRVLLKKDWDLDIFIPPDRLVPTLPLRLNYLLWLEDILAAVDKGNQNKPVYGIDIGTGASCVYPVLAAKKNGWHMLATEIDEKSLNHATENVKRNKLEELIKVQQVSGDSPLREAIEKSSDSNSAGISYDFCMCNPPFFSNEDEIDNSECSRSPVRPRNPPRNARTGTIREVVIEGGEVAFVSKIIAEGKELQDKIRILTTMLGHKSSVTRVTKLLEEAGVKNVVRTEFCQGRTMRWGLAWSHTVDLSTAKTVSQTTKKEKSRPPLHYLVPENCGKNVEDITQRILNILDSLSVEYEQLEKEPNRTAFKATAYVNTWSNQRRKRREEKRQLKELSKLESEPSQTVTDETAESKDDTETTKKRVIEDSSDSDAKRLKIDKSMTPILVVTLVIRGSELTWLGDDDDEEDDDDDDDDDRKQSRVLLEMSWIEGTGGRELVHQVLQHIKNNLHPKQKKISSPS